MNGRWRDRDPAEAPPGVKPVIRLRAPLTGETGNRGPGPGRAGGAERSTSTTSCCCVDGTPTTLLAVVVDDHDMTSLTSSAATTTYQRGAADPDLQCARLEGAGHGPHPADPRPDGSSFPSATARSASMLPRHGLPAGGDAQLPGAARLEPRDQEIFSTQEMVAAFDLPQIGRSPARFDFAKLESLMGTTCAR